jgi:hypothetical protein
MIDTHRELEHLAARITDLERAEAAIIGTFTPAYEGAAVPGVTTYTTQTGYYMRIGNWCIFALTVVWTAATGSGNVRITQLPFNNADTLDTAISCRTNSVTFANGSVQAFVTASGAFARLQSPATNAASTDVTVETAGEIRLEGAYRVA